MQETEPGWLSGLGLTLWLLPLGAVAVVYGIFAAPMQTMAACAVVAVLAYLLRGRR